MERLRILLQGLGSVFSRIWRVTYVREALLVGALIGGILFVQHNLLNWVRARANAWVQDYASAVTIPDSIQASLKSAKTSNEAEQARIEAQFQQVRQRAKHHLEVTIDFYGWYYMSIVMSSITGALAAIALFWITKNGWSTASSYGIILFVGMTAAALFFRAFPAMFKQEQNIADNKQLYLQYVAMGNEVKSYCVTGESMSGQPMRPSQFIHYLDNRLLQTNNIALGFDSTAVPKYETLGETKGQKQ